MVTAAQARGHSPPLFRHEDRRLAYALTFPTLAANELSISVIRGHGLFVNGRDEPSAYVRVEVPAPTGDAVSAATSGVCARGSAAAFACTRVFAVERSRTLARFYERRKVVVDVFHHRGLLFRAQHVGRATIPLAPLITQSQLTLSLEVPFLKLHVTLITALIL